MCETMITSTIVLQLSKWLWPQNTIEMLLPISFTLHTPTHFIALYDG